jgi:hypothetical protein
MRRAIVVMFVALTGCNRSNGETIPERVSCRDCRIDIQPVLTIGDTTDAGMLTGRPTGVLVDGRGRYWINVLDAFPMIHEPATRTTRQFGRPGDGPGEYRNPFILAVLPGDSVLVSDRFNLHVVAPDLTITRTGQRNPGERPPRVLRWPNLLVGALSDHDRQTRRVRTVVVLYDVAGETFVLRDTVMTTSYVDGGNPAEWASSLRLVGLASDTGGFWISDLNTYRLVRYSSSGEPQDSFRRKPRWFPGGQSLRFGSATKPPNPAMIDHWVDAAGLLWVLVAQPRDDAPAAWREVAVRRGGSGVGEMSVAAMPADYRLKRTVIEVIDPAAHRVVARHTFDGYIFDVLPGNRVASFVETPEGIPIITVHQLTLHRPE